MFIITNWARPQLSKENPVADPIPYQLLDAIKKNDAGNLTVESLSKDFINTSLPNRELPLHYAIRQHSDKIIKLLFEHPHIDLRKKDDQGLTVLDHVFLINNQEIKALVLSHFFKQNIEAIKNCANNVSTQQIDEIKQEICKNASSDLSALHLAAMSGNLEKVRNIVSSGASLNEQTAVGETALHFAALAGSEPVVSWLLAQGARTDLLTNRKVSALHTAALSNNTGTIKLLIEKGLNPNINDDSGYTPLHYAALLREDFTNARVLIENGADPSIETSQISPLALMISSAKRRSHEHDPLKLDLLQTLICACSIAVWIQSYYNNNADLLTLVLQYALSSVITLDHLLQVYNASKDLRSTVTASFGLSMSIAMALIPHLDYTRLHQGASLYLLFRVFVASQSAWEALKTGWRNRSLDTLRSFRKVAIHSINAGFSMLSLWQRVQKIWQNSNLKIEVESQLANGECQAAYKSASEMHWYPREEALLDIVSKCEREGLPFSRQIASEIYNPNIQDSALNKIIDRALLEEDFKGTFEAGSMMNDKNNQLATWMKIAQHPECSFNKAFSSNTANKCQEVQQLVKSKLEGFFGKDYMKRNFRNFAKSENAANPSASGNLEYVIGKANEFFQSVDSVASSVVPYVASHIAPHIAIITSLVASIAGMRFVLQHKRPIFIYPDT